MVISFFMPDTIDHYIQDFLNYLQFQKRYSKHTIVSYETDLIAFRDFLAIHVCKVPYHNAVRDGLRSIPS